MAGKPHANQGRASATPAIIRFLAFLERHSRLLALALILIASVRIVSTYSVFSHTSDEPAHVACGIEWLANGVYTWEPQHPPLARVAVALGPYLIGARPQNTPRVDIYSMTTEGVAILFQGNHYDETVALARLGVLPFFWIACLAVYWWGLRYYGAAEGVIALLLFSFLPPVLAHGGLATTDMPLTAFLGAAFLTCLIWIAQPTLRHGALFGACAGLAVISKFSTLVYFPAAVALALLGFYLIERPGIRAIAAAIRERIPSLGLAALIACLLIWAMYRFSFGPTSFGIRLPAPELYAGIEQVMKHNAEGHPSYLLGQVMRNGVWYYFPLLLAIKTPIGFLLLLGLGMGMALGKWGRAQRAWLPLAYSAGILLVALFSHINIGVRHVLPAYAGFALLAAVGVVRLLRTARSVQWASAAVGILVVWFAGASILCHPDYLPYFNEFAGDHPENIVVDSDLDWGQDMKRLAKRLNQARADSVAMLPFLRELPQGAFGLPPMQTRIDALNPFPGWNAVSLTILKENRLGLGRHPEYSPWPDRVPVPGERIGKGILLWYFPPAK
jgi:Dolichyl-phosphate-mannose-protein mannosyltransferase